MLDIHTAEPVVPELSLVKLEIAIGKLKRYKSQGSDQIPAEMIKVSSEMRKCIRSIWNKKKLP
jgi:hypothetical protein